MADTTQKVALITGAANRVGATIASRLAASGYAIIIHFRTSDEEARARVRELQAQGYKAAAEQADLSNTSERGTLVQRAARHFGPLTALINNASLFKPDSVFDLDEELWDAHFDVHIKAPAFLCRDFANQLPDETKGNIINIIDERVLNIAPDNFSYTLSKSALWTATRTMAQSLAPHIRVNAIGPGPTLPNERQTKEEFEASKKVLPLQTSGTPDEIADAILFFLNAPSISGQMLALDGAEHLGFCERDKPTPRRS